MKINVSQIGAAVIPVGVYDLEITRCEEGISKTGQPKIAWEFVTNDGEVLTLHTTLTPGKNFSTIDILKAVGVGMETDEDGNIEVDPNDLIGCHVRAQVEHETFQGRTRAVPRKFMPIK